MRISIDNIRDGVSTMEFDCKPDEIDLELESVSFVGSVSASLKLVKQDVNVYIQARMSVVMETECARCLKPVRRTLKATSENQYEPLPDLTGKPQEEIGIRYYSDEYIDLSEDLRENLLLEVPARVLCSDDCKGLCPHCGQDLNTGKCNCSLESEEVKTGKFAEFARSLELKRKLEV